MAADQERADWVEPYREAVRKRVCSRCVDRTFDGKCGLTGEMECAFIRFAPQVVLAILSRSADHFEDYLWAIRTYVCSACRHQDDTGYCPLRESAACPLNRYLPLIVDAINDVGPSFLPKR